MMQINVGDHTSSQAGYIAWPGNRVGLARWARTKAIWVAANISTANPYFRGLPGGRSLTQLLADRSIWINFHPTMPHFGETNFAGGKEVAISVTSCRIGRWTVLATLVHELAHVNGDDGSGTGAELAVLACGMGRDVERTSGIDDRRTPYDPDIHG